MKMITAIVRTTSLKRIVENLGENGIKGMTISEVRGIGDQVEIDRPYAIHNRIEIIVTDEKVDEVVSLIVYYSHTGIAGDGIIAVSPIETAIKIRTREKLH